MSSRAQVLLKISFVAAFMTAAAERDQIFGTIMPEATPSLLMMDL
jgi:hypothetical protein